MVTSRRQIDREEDRYGGFEQDAPVTERAERRTVSDSVRRVHDAPAREDAVSADTRRPDIVMRPASPRAQRGYDRTIAPSRPQHHSDIMPEVRRGEEVKIVREQKLTAATKRMLIVYLSIVLSIVVAIVITGIIAGSLSSDISSLERSVSEQTAALSDLEVDISGVYADAKQWAENNMVKAEDANQGTYEELTPSDGSDVSDELFDSIRDWVNSVFGG